MTKQFLFLDTETTGLTEADRVIQIAKKTPDNPITDIYFCCPPVPISFEAMSINHITQARVDNEPPFSEIAKEIQEAVSDSILVAHNAAFDIGMLQREGIEIGEYICTKKLAQYLWDEPSHRLQYLRYRFDLNIDGEAHSAEGDVAVLEALFNFIYQAMEDGDHEAVVAKMIEISQRPVLLRRITFGKHKGVEFKDIPTDYLQWLNGQSDLDEDMKFTLKHYLYPDEK